ncbi:hypothetical protein F8388_003300 [Cannabis sativa]|uniref:OTU domain-containing protein n=1 Tax=Cannabis sativa TaxID=3483 RepID=A0A7J6E5H4_CANSA|nr:hypothetical protein F8388_003300 [Cannabis sativa]KAF4366414.1 hypothetical protein G4B88_003126 [Cannabis sativa]
MEIQEDNRVKEKLLYLTRTNTHCKTPAVPVHTEGPVFTSESCIRRPTEAARETKDTTYAKNSQSFNLCGGEFERVFGFSEEESDIGLSVENDGFDVFSGDELDVFSGDGLDVFSGLISSWTRKRGKEGKDEEDIDRTRGGSSNGQACSLLSQVLRKEISTLQNKEIELKKAAAKGSKAEQKAKKKQVEKEITKRSFELKEKHAEELASLGVQGGEERGARKKQQENKEYRKNKATFQPDGHCLYRAVEDQLAVLSGGRSPHNYQELRELVASYMRKNASDFLPFFLSENAVEDDGSDDSLAEKFENYCKEVETTAAWGGQLELEALTHYLRKHIMVFSGSFPDVEMGKEYKSNSGTDTSIRLSYHKHAFGLGEHYNSVVPIVTK